MWNCIQSEWEAGNIDIHIGLVGAWDEKDHSGCGAPSAAVVGCATGASVMDWLDLMDWIEG